MSLGRGQYLKSFAGLAKAVDYRTVKKALTQLERCEYVRTEKAATPNG